MKIHMNDPFNARDDVLKLFFRDFDAKHSCGYDLPDGKHDVWFPNIGDKPGRTGWLNRLIDEERHHYLQEVNVDPRKNTARTDQRIRFVFGFFGPNDIRFIGVYQSIEKKEDGFWYERIGEEVEDTEVFLNWTPNDSFSCLLEKYLKEDYLDSLKINSPSELAEKYCELTRSIMSAYRTGKKLPTRENVFKLAFALHLNENETNNLLHAAGYHTSAEPTDEIFMTQIKKHNYRLDDLKELLERKGLYLYK